MDQIRTLTQQEAKVVNMLRDAWNEFIRLPKLHDDDSGEFRHAVHNAQNIVMSRPVYEHLNGLLE